MSQPISLRVASRVSPLAIAQVDEVIANLRTYCSDLVVQPTWVRTIGDRDQVTSLRTLDKTDFFTREVDALVLNGDCDIAVHSAKDLPEPIPAGLALIALTQGIDPADTLVLRPGETFDSLPSGATIATSSVRREDAVRRLRSDLTFVDIRGAIDHRLAKLANHEVDGVVVAMAALIRLQLTHLNYLILPGDTVPGQGRLAVMARADNEVMKQLFQPLDAR